nr:Asp-tRNA(Asn)/Glu-tRNA(Gln) amidotransferase subunit GatA [Candidatus Saccharibacteria bacterium]
VSESQPIKKIAVVKEYMSEAVSDEVKTSITNVVDKLKSSGVVVEEVSIPSVKHALAVYYILAPAEISSNLARYDGVKFGLRAESDSLEEMYTKTKDEGFGYEAKRRIMIGAYVLSSGFYDAYYQKSQKVRTLIINDFNSAFEKYDLLIGPTSPTTAFKLGEVSKDPIQMYLQDIMTVSASLAGLPAISVPIEPEGEMPVGLQIIGKHGRDSQVLQLASQVEETQNG